MILNSSNLISSSTTGSRSRMQHTQINRVYFKNRCAQGEISSRGRGKICIALVHKSRAHLVRALNNRLIARARPPPPPRARAPLTCDGNQTGQTDRRRRRRRQSVILHLRLSRRRASKRRATCRHLDNDNLARARARTSTFII